MIESIQNSKVFLVPLEVVIYAVFGIENDENDTFTRNKPEVP